MSKGRNMLEVEILEQRDCPSIAGAILQNGALVVVADPGDAPTLEIQAGLYNGHQEFSVSQHPGTGPQLYGTPGVVIDNKMFDASLVQAIAINGGFSQVNLWSTQTNGTPIAIDVSNPT